MDSFTNYILGDKKSIVLTKDDFASLSKEASKAYLEESVPMDQTIKKIASRESLNSDQVKRVVEGANLLTFSTMFKQGYEGNIDYDLANPESILEPSATKTASYDDSIVSAPKDRYIPGADRVDWADVFKSESVEQEKVASKTQWEILGEMDEIKQMASDYVEKQASFNIQSGLLQNIMRGYVAEGCKPYEVVAMVKSAGVDRALAEVLIQHMPEFNTKVAAEVKGEADKTHQLYKEAAKMAKLASDVVELRQKLLEVKEGEDLMLAALAARVV